MPAVRTAGVKPAARYTHTQTALVLDVRDGHDRKREPREPSFIGLPFRFRELEALFAPGAPTPPAAVIIDCGMLEYVSSAGLRVFLLGARAAQKAGIAFAICDLKPAVREVFDLSGFSRVLAVHPDRATALGQGPRRT